MVVDITVAVVLAAFVAAITILGGVIAGRTTKERGVFWCLGLCAFLLTIIQAVRQAQSQDASFKTITGGDSFAFVRLQVGSDGVYPVVLNSGKYPLYDLRMRLWDPEEWKPLPATSDAWAKIASETVQLGTLPNDDYRNGVKLPMPAAGKQYAVEFSARNGSWTQTIWLRQSVKGWKTASFVQRTPRISKGPPTPGPKLCYYIDQGFPFQSGDATDWAKDTPACVTGSNP